MKDLNTLESQLRSWTPRRPSPKLKALLFAQQSLPVEPEVLEPFLRRWLAPAMAVFVTLMICGSRGPDQLNEFIHSPSSGLVASVALSQPELATYYAGAIHSDHNVWPVTTFAWTKGSHSLTTAVPVWNTNSLMP